MDLYDELREICESLDENFVFLNEQGEPLLKQKLFFTWSDFPTIKLFLVCSPDDSILQIKTLLSISLEKYPIFTGIKSLKLQISTDKPLEDKTTIGLYIKPEQEFYFQVSASEVWLEVQVELRDLLGVLFFKIKVTMETKLRSLRRFFTDLLNNVLKIQNSSVELLEETIVLQNIKLSEEEFVGYDLRGMLLNKHSKFKGLERIEYENSVKDYFDVKNHFLLCVPPVKSIGVGGKGRKSSFRALYGPAFLHVLQNFDFGFVVSNASFESKGYTKMQRPISGQIKRKVTLQEPQSKACNCLIS